MTSKSNDGIRKKLNDELDEANWEMLSDHYQRGSLICVSQDLDLVDVGVHVATDDVTTVQSWLSKGDIGRPSDLQIRKWELQPEKKVKFLIVQPYVLYQEKAN